MKMAICASMIGLLAVAAPTLGQCSSVDTLVAIANANNGYLMRQYDDGGAAIFITADASKHVSVFATDANGVGHVCTDYTEDSSGTGTLTDGVVTCTLNCDSGGVVMSIEGADFKAAKYGITKSGSLVVFGQGAFKQVFSEAFGWAQDGHQQMDLSTPIDADHLAVTGTNELGQSFTVTATVLLPSTVDGSSVTTFWIGTVATNLATVPCAGISFTNGEESFLLPMASFADEASGLDFFATPPPSFAVAVCAHWDATAQGESDNLHNDYNACNDRIFVRHTLIIAGCGAGALVCCCTVWIPNPASIPCCIATIGCMGGALLSDIDNTIELIIERRRVAACICNNATTRSNGGTPGACTLTCPIH